MPGLIKYDVNIKPIMSTTANSETYLIGTLHFNSWDDIKAVFASDVGQAWAADRKILVPDNDKIQIYLFNTEEV